MGERQRSREKTARLFERVIKKTLIRPEELTVSQWAEVYRVLDEASNMSGRWNNAVTPYLIEIMDAFNDPYIREIYFCKASQIGGTEALINILCYLIASSPAPAMIVYPSDDLAKDISNDKLRPAFNLVPKIKSLFLENSSKELRLKFKTMTLYLRGAGSPAKLASKAIKYLFFDEIDKMGGASKKEASPFNLALERTKTYKMQSKVFACSTPTIKENYIWKLHDEADEVRHYFVPCPHCGKRIELKWKQIQFEKDDEKRMSNYERAQTAVYICQECQGEIKDTDKPKMLREGSWEAVKKRGVGKAKRVGYWINSLYSIFVKWSDVVEEFLKTKDDPEELQNFVNSWLAEPWEDTRLRTSEDLVMDRQTKNKQFAVPDWAKLITGGVDVQETSLYYTIRAWGNYMTSQNITHGQVLSFAEIEKEMNVEFAKENGEKMQVALCLVDSGYEADATYNFCVNNSDWALPCKGSSNAMQNHFKISKVNKPGSKAEGMKLVLVDGGKYKDMIAARMQRENGERSGSWMVYDGCDAEYAKQVTAEHKVAERAVNGKKKLVWQLKHTHADNHYLDCEVYAMAAADIMGARTLHLAETENEETIVETKQEEVNGWISTGENWLGG